VLRNLVQFLPPYLVEESPQRHCFALQQTLADFRIAKLRQIQLQIWDSYVRG